MSLRSRLRRLVRQAPAPISQTPTAVAFLDDGQRLALIEYVWVSWPADRPIPRVCKVYLFDPRGLFEPSSRT